MTKQKTKLALGSANFGMDYGLSNQAGKLSSAELEKILIEAERAGVEIIDTAKAYGDSELRIGSICCDRSFKIVTKIGIGLEKNYTPNSLTKLVSESCERLCRSEVYAVMLHRPEVLLSDCGPLVVEELINLKARNVISKIGVSVYDPMILGEISKIIELDILQAPFNIFDRRILLSGWARKLQENGTEIHIRSVFLQGLLLQSEATLPRYFSSKWPDLFNAWFAYLDKSRNDAVATSLGFVLKQPWVDNVVVGVDSVEQLKALLHLESSLDLKSYPNLISDDENLIDPSKWKIT